MQGTQVEPGTSQFRRPWATSVTRRISTKMMRPDLSHSRRFMSAPYAVIDFSTRVISYHQAAIEFINGKRPGVRLAR